MSGLQEAKKRILDDLTGSLSSPTTIAEVQAYYRPMLDALIDEAQQEVLAGLKLNIPRFSRLHEEVKDDSIPAGE